MKRLGANTDQVKAAAGAWERYAKAQGLAGERANWTKEDKAGVRAWEAQTVSSVRTVTNVERILEDERAKSHASRMRQIQAEDIRTAASMKRQTEMQHRETERMVEQRAHGESHHGVRNYALQTAALAVSAHGIMSGIEATLEHGAEYQHRLVALQNTGRTPAEIAEMNQASHAAIRGVPTATLTENLEILTETVGAFGSVEHAMEHLPFMNKAAAILHAVAGDKISDSAGQMGNKFARFFEMRGTAGNSELFEKEASEMMKYMVFSGGNVNPTELLNFAQQAKSALQNYNLHFLSRIALSLIGEVGGDRTGTQANAFNSVILGKVNDKKQAEAWLNFELVDPTKMTMKAGHAVGWSGGAVYNTDKALQDPLAFGEDWLLGKLSKHGVNIADKLDLTKALGTLFRNQNANAFANELWQYQNRQRLHKDDPFIGKVETPDAMYKRLLTTDPTFALIALKASLGNFLTTLSSPVMAPAARILSGMAESMNDLALVAHNNPVTAVTGGLAAAAGSLYAAGRLSYGMLNGFGNATFGPAAGEMVAAGHEQLAAGRIMVGAAEAMRVGAIEHDLPGVVPGGKLGGVVREGEALAKGALTVEALEIAATAGVTLTAGTVALVGLSTAAIIAALSHSIEPKHYKGQDPDYGNPFAAGKGFDINDPRFRDPASMSDEDKRAARNEGAHPRGSVKSQADTDVKGHIVVGRGGVHEWVRDEYQPLKNAPYFSTAPLGTDGRPLGRMPNGWMGGRVPVDPSTGSIFGQNTPLIDPRLYSPANVPLPPSRPVDHSLDGIENRTLQNWMNWARPEAASGALPPAVPPPRGPEWPSSSPQVDTSGIDAVKTKASEAHAALDGLNMGVAPQISMAALDAFIAKASEAKALMASLGSVGGGPNASISPRRSFNRPPLGATV